jgi:hypothetical protein
MLSAKYCRRQAAACLRLAEQRRTAKSKQRTRDAAANWERLAIEADKEEIEQRAGKTRTRTK